MEPGRDRTFLCERRRSFTVRECTFAHDGGDLPVAKPENGAFGIVHRFAVEAKIVCVAAATTDARPGRRGGGATRPSDEHTPAVATLRAYSPATALTENAPLDAALTRVARDSTVNFEEACEPLLSLVVVVAPSAASCLPCVLGQRAVFFLCLVAPNRTCAGAPAIAVLAVVVGTCTIMPFPGLSGAVNGPRPRSEKPTPMTEQSSQG